MTDRSAVEAAITEAHRDAWGLVLAATARTTGELELAEECVQEAYAAALQSWIRDGIPRNPAAWLTTTAKRRAVDTVRRRHTLRSKLPLLVEPAAGVADPTPDRAMIIDEDPDEAVPDERLRLIFTCCHPALAQDAQVALTLRLVCGVSTPDIARAFLVPESTMAKRISRAKRKITEARIPYRIPGAAELPDRLRSVLTVIHLVFTTGHTAPSGAALVRVELVERAVQLTRVLAALMPDEPEVQGLLALILVTDARRETRVDAAGRLLRLEEQDRSRWDRAALAEGHELIMKLLRGGRAGRYVVQAAIASLYSRAETYDRTDWPQILTLYDRLLELWPSPVVALNRAVPLAMVAGPAAALSAVEEIEAAGDLAEYPYLFAVKADLLHRLGRRSEATAAYRQALDLTDNDAERAFLSPRLVDDSGEDPAANSRPNPPR
ncbi:RNA polymerase sigma factor [Microlunatus parietis]|uniref:RNA polymerase sigma-70 factor (ECF subfamily) n=1 Tax=Microlunatus parietis TaxID=682979 RepID=A0A7Y9I9P7_9ACTN|nr:RNA polymerase sigma factor [Microlunatus parietis]NYE72670.1 RNA polymerase sigma-70 factor (ECF subfamily) [Microlunatus parietis]